MPGTPHSHLKVTPPPRAPVPWPTKICTQSLYTNLKRKPATVVGPDPAELVSIIEQAFTPITLREAEGVDDVLRRGGEQLFERDVAKIQSAILRLGTSIPASVRAMYAADGMEGAAASTFDVDPVMIAVQRLLQTDDMTAVKSIMTAVRVLAEVEKAACAPSGGRAAVIDPVYMIVRVVVVYLTRHNMPVRAKWNVPKPLKAPAKHRDQGGTCLPVSEDAELLCLVADLLGIRVSSTTLRGALGRYLRRLNKENRGSSESDAMRIAFTPS